MCRPNKVLFFFSNSNQIVFHYFDIKKLDFNTDIIGDPSFTLKVNFFFLYRHFFEMADENPGPQQQIPVDENLFLSMFYYCSVHFIGRRFIFFFEAKKFAFINGETL